MDVEGSEVVTDADGAVTVLASEAVAAVAELARVKAEYAAFRARVIATGHDESRRRGWCDDWKQIAIEKIGIRPDELPPTHAKVSVHFAGGPISFDMECDRRGEISARRIAGRLGDELRYGAAGEELSKRSDWFTVTPIYAAPADDDDDDD